MLILAGVSINAIVGDNGIITNAQNANMKSGMVALEEWLQGKYVEYYDEVDNYSSKPELLNAKIRNLLLKDGSRNYIINEGKVYYLINKSILPNELKENLIGGNGYLDYSKYTRLIDVYGVTTDLKIYYCNYEDDKNPVIFGNLEVNDLDLNLPANSVNSDSIAKAMITDVLSGMGISVDQKLGVTIGNASAIKDLSIDGTNYNLISLNALSDIKNLKTLTLSNLTLSDLNGLEGCPGLYYIYLKNCNIADYSNLSTVLKLQYLYFYLPDTMTEEIANNQVSSLGIGLKNASGLNKLEYLSFSGATNIVEGYQGGSYVFKIGDSRDKYTFSPTDYSNLSNLDGLKEFNETIKSNLKYLYLNNNNIISVDSLRDFSALYELLLNCNPNLVSLNGLKNHTTITYLTAHVTGLEDIKNLEGCSGLMYLTIQKNNKIESLEGIEDAEDLNLLLAYECSLTDITALENHISLYYLNLRDNVDLENVIILGSCVGITNLYLANNDNMIGTDIRDALADPETTILANCGKNYSIPSRYMIYFSATASSIDYSYDTYGDYLTDTSDAINALKNKTGVTRLNLKGQSQLSDAKIQEILSTMTGLEYLSLEGCSNLESIDFVGIENLEDGTIKNKVTKLVELNIVDVKTSLTDLSNLNEYATDLQRLAISNPNIEFEGIVETLNRFKVLDLNNSWMIKSSWACAGLVFGGDWSYCDFSECTGLTKLVAINSPFSKTETVYGTLDLSSTSVEQVYSNYGTIKIPSTCYYASTLSGNFDLSSASCLEILRITGRHSYNEISSIFSGLNKNSKLKSIELCKNNGGSINWISGIDTTELETLLLLGNGSNYQPSDYSDLSGLAYATNLKKLIINGSNVLTNITELSYLTNLENLEITDNKELLSISGFANCVNLKQLTIANNPNLGTITGLESISGLEKINIYNTNISNINFMNNKTKLTIQYDEKGKVSWDTLSLFNQNITDLSPLLGMIVEGKQLNIHKINLSNNSLEDEVSSTNSNLKTLEKLHDAGITYITITGNNFSQNGINKIIEIFGSKNVKN